MAGGDFVERAEELRERMGDGILEGNVTVDQVYALYQHEGADFNHPRGGEAFYLARPLLEGQDIMLGAFAAVLDGHETAVDVMIGNMMGLADTTPIKAPVEFNVLRQSASPAVIDNGAEVFKLPPAMPRLTQAELNEIRRIGEPIVNPAEWLRQFRFHRGEGGR
jgi:hypothetical protein